MPVLELALLSVLSSEPNQIEQQLEAVKPILRRAKLAMENHSKRPNAFRYLRSMSHPERIYVLGEWDSVEDHVQNFVPGEENQSVLIELEGKMRLEWIGHFDVELEEVVQGPLREGELGESMAIERRYLGSNERDAFEKRWREWEVEKMTQGGEKVIGGWRVDDMKAEYLLPEEKNVEVFVTFNRFTTALVVMSTDDVPGPVGVLASDDCVKVLDLE